MFKKRSFGIVLTVDYSCVLEEKRVLQEGLCKSPTRSFMRSILHVVKKLDKLLGFDMIASSTSSRTQRCYRAIRCSSSRGQYSTHHRCVHDVQDSEL